MSGYIRNDTSNEIADGNVINAAPLDGEFNAIQAAFNVSSGHTHNGSTDGDGGPISKLGPSQQLTQTTTALTPSGDNTIDLGTSSAQFKDLHLNGIANIDRLVIAASDGSADGVGSHLQPMTNASFDLGSTTYLWNNAYLVNLNVRKNDAPVITLTNTSTDMLAADSVGSIVFETLDTQQSGVDVAKIDAVIVDTLDDTGGDDVKLVFQTGNAEALTTALTLQDDDVIAPDDVFLRSDAAVLNFGADDDVNLTHVADTGLLLNAAMEFQFRDSGLTIGSTTDGQLDIQADTKAKITAPTTELSEDLSITHDGTVIALGVDGDVTLTHVADTALRINDAIELQFRDSALSIGSSADGQLDIDADSAIEMTSTAIKAVGRLENADLQPTSGTGTNAAGTNLVISGGQGTGSGTGGNILLKVSKAGSSGSSANAFATAVTIDEDKKATFEGAIAVNGNVVLGDAATDTVTITADVASNIIPSADNTHDLGASGSEWKDLYINGVAYVDSIAMPTTTVTDILDEDNMSSDSATALATQQSIKAYVDTEVAAVGGSFGANIVFEGATANDFETTVAVTDPTADRTITLPDETGNVIIDAKAQEFTKTQNFNATTLTDASTIAWDASSNQVTSVELTSSVGNRCALGAPTNLIDGGVYVLMVKQDSTGSRTIGPWNAVFKWAAGRTPTLTTAGSAKDIFTFLSDGTNLYEIGRSLNAS